VQDVHAHTTALKNEFFLAMVFTLLPSMCHCCPLCSSTAALYVLPPPLSMCHHCCPLYMPPLPPLPPSTCHHRHPLCTAAATLYVPPLLPSTCHHHFMRQIRCGSGRAGIGSGPTTGCGHGFSGVDHCADSAFVSSISMRVMVSMTSSHKLGSPAVRRRQWDTARIILYN